VRIVAGEWRGRTIAAPPGPAVRPTTDRVREAWMSIVHLALPGARVVDLCAGSGALGLEALSRGAVHATFVDDSARALRVLRENVERLGAGDRVTIVKGDAVKFVAELEAGAFDVGFADPPYGTGVAQALVERWLADPYAGVLGVEHGVREEMDEAGGGRGDRRTYGDSAVTIFRVE
jgi:16S rRNA (guanine966-N2)-methyltransferase